MTLNLLSSIMLVIVVLAASGLAYWFLVYTDWPRQDRFYDVDELVNRRGPLSRQLP